jgi:hypothetical protein
LSICQAIGDGSGTRTIFADHSSFAEQLVSAPRFGEREALREDWLDVSGTEAFEKRDQILPEEGRLQAHQCLDGCKGRRACGRGEAKRQSLPPLREPVRP